MEEEIDPPVTIPDIPAELEPVMRGVAVAAKADWIATLHDSVPVQLGLAIEPDREWLGGPYLADASRFASIEQYWRGLERYLTDVRAREERMFVSLYQARLDTAGVTGPEADLLVE